MSVCEVDKGPDDGYHRIYIKGVDPAVLPSSFVFQDNAGVLIGLAPTLV